MEAHKIPVDCFSIRYTATGSTEELTSVWEFYREEYPTIQYGTRVEKRSENTIIIHRFKTIKDCKNACLHEVSTAPLDKGQDHTIFQTT